MLDNKNGKNTRRKSGQIVRINLHDDSFVYARVLNEPLVAFYGKIYRKEIEDFSELEAVPIVFTLMVMNHAVTKGRWPVVAKAPLPSQLEVAPRFCKQDARTGALTIYHEVSELAPHYERPAKVGECDGLEVAAVWEPEHVEDRLRDHFANRPNKWVEQLKVKPS